DYVSRAATPDDIEQAKKQGRHCLYLSSNGVPLLKRFGAGHVAIGWHRHRLHTSARPRGESQNGPRSERAPRYEAFWPPGALDSRSHPSLAWTNWPMFTVGMVQRGISDTDIQKILGGNVMRVTRAVFPNAAA
ncbi:MAG: hypothetical protein JJE04_22505, partial [Acidobacteriia bacterium]|nr:hypothetical protein [Terriglobia bacterium]